MADVYYNLIVDDDDGDGDSDGGDGGDGGDGSLDTQWITAYENNILFNEYELFLKSDITRVSFRFMYLDRNKKCVEFVVPTAAAESYTLQRVNQITQSELFQIIHRRQNVTTATKKKYYNFHSLLLYEFQLEEDNNDNVVRSVAQYISSPAPADVDFGRVIEYTNILSFETIYFQPLVAMFHDLIEFTVVLYED
jgi:hypothetical protein